MRGRIGSGLWALGALIFVMGCDDAGDDAGGDATPPPSCEEGAERACLVDEGTGCQGVQACVGGSFGSCRVPEETCDGADNDCDGSTDEDYPGVGLVCRMGVGACRREGRVTCTFDGAGAICDALPAPPSDEICDGIDNDCDDDVDEEVPSGELCDTGRDGACNAGRTLCADAQVLCSASTSPTDEVCDGIDNDCDGRADESNAGGPLVEPCYDGPAGTEAVGVCTGGISRCVDGRFGACEGQVVPVAEVCDAVDNDCNGAVDDPAEGCACPPGELLPCYAGPDGTEGVGPCLAGVARCLPDGSGVEACMGAVGPGVEICDGIDNDCNGRVDDVPGVGDACNAGVGACSRPGRRVCDVGDRAVVCDAFPGAPSIETCNGIDDDCDGLVDDVDGAGLPCQGGVGACAAPGIQTCDAEAAALVCRANERPPGVESCNNIDDDCNGITDDVEGIGDACEVGVGACVRAGAQVCGPRGVECDAIAGAAAEETCNDIDDDCNGITDDVEGVGAACTAGVGACLSEGLGICGPDGVDCDAIPGDAQDEACNGIDDDCDGRTDEAGVCPEICGDGLDNDDDGATDCDDAEDCERDPFCAYDSCRAALDGGQARSGVYLIRTADGGVADLYCDMATDGGGWTLVASTSTTTLDDYGVAYYPDLTTLAPAGGNPGVYNGLDFGPQTDIRFACRAVQAPANAPMVVDLSFYRTPWYAEFAAAATDAQSCFSEDNGVGFDEPPPQRRNNLTGEVIGANTAWSAGTLEGEDFCGDTQDFSVDFNDRGMKSDINDGTDWGEDGGRIKCGVSGVRNGQWFIFVREVTERAPEICDDGIDDDQDGSLDCADYDCIDDPICRERQGELRLVDGFGPGTGRIEMRVNGRWGSICDDNFGLIDADVACQQLGFPGAQSVLGEYGGGIGTIWMDEVACTGDELMLLDCPSSPLGSSDCPHDEDVGVQCLLGGQCRIDGHCTGGAVCLDGECFGGELCDDEADNDEDGLVDCDDPDCAPSDACAECLVDGACDVGQICVERVCIDGCREDAQCGADAICDGALLTCVAGCRDDAGCGDGQICDAMSCRGGCRADEDCGADEICDLDALVCLGGCRADADCGVARICEAEQCVAGCRVDPGCGPGNICEGGLCTGGCRDDGTCGPGRICQALTCVDGCRDDAQCAPGQICEPDACVAGCRDDAGCPVAGEVCLDGQCGVLPAEICDNGIDDDRDGAQDCADDDCAAGPDCAVPIAAQQLSVNIDATLDARDAGWDSPAADCRPGDGGSHPFDALHIVNPTDTPQRLRITAAWPAGRDGTLHVFQSPFAPPAGCVDGEPLEEVAIGPGETRVIVAASAAPDDRFGAYRVVVETLLFQPVDYCRLQFPESVVAAPGDVTEVYGRIYEAGTTDRSNGNDFNPFLAAAVGYGPDGSDPAGDGWQWFGAVPNPGYGGEERDNDEYFAQVTVPDDPAGPDVVEYDYAFRFTVDRGRSMTYCDLDGDGATLGAGDPAAGYSPDQAGAMTSDRIIAYCREACTDATDCGLILAVYPGGYDECYEDCTTNPVRRPQAQCIAEGFDPPDDCNPQVAFDCGLLP